MGIICLRYKYIQLVNGGTKTQPRSSGHRRKISWIIFKCPQGIPRKKNPKNPGRRSSRFTLFVVVFVLSVQQIRHGLSSFFLINITF